MTIETISVDDFDTEELRSAGYRPDVQILLPEARETETF